MLDLERLLGLYQIIVRKILIQRQRIHWNSIEKNIILMLKLRLWMFQKWIFIQLMKWFFQIKVKYLFPKVSEL